mmetsp:Transcript_33996/g.54481  ORF Transcript_33996/g.54481 Transcript_33996/m.54481 type:complete len:355 (+) Transcript_33996:193-1257(+)
MCCAYKHKNGDLLVLFTFTFIPHTNAWWAHWTVDAIPVLSSSAYSSCQIAAAVDLDTAALVVAHTFHIAADAFHLDCHNSIDYHTAGSFHVDYILVHLADSFHLDCDYYCILGSSGYSCYYYPYCCSVDFFLADCPDFDHLVLDHPCLVADCSHCCSFDHRPYFHGYSFRPSYRPYSCCQDVLHDLLYSTNYRHHQWCFHRFLLWSTSAPARSARSPSSPWNNDGNAWQMRLCRRFEFEHTHTSKLVAATRTPPMLSFSFVHHWAESPTIYDVDCVDIAEYCVLCSTHSTDPPLIEPHTARSKSPSIQSSCKTLPTHSCLCRIYGTLYSLSCRPCSRHLHLLRRSPQLHRLQSH